MNVLLVAATEAEAAVFRKPLFPGVVRDSISGRDGTSQPDDFPGQDGTPQRDGLPERDGTSDSCGPSDSSGLSGVDDRADGSGLSGVDGRAYGYGPSGVDGKGNINLSILVTGIGSIATSWALTRRFCTGPRPDLVINAGIAGSFRDSIRTGDVVMPVSDCFADAGVESAEGFLTLSEAGLQDPDTHPFTGGRINAYSCPAGFQYPGSDRLHDPCFGTFQDPVTGDSQNSGAAGFQDNVTGSFHYPGSGDRHGGSSPFSGERSVVPDSFFKLAAADIRPVKAVTVNTVTGTRETAGRLMLKYDPDIETMEGAAFFYVCSREGIPFIALRAVSNRVGIRDRGSWNIALALENLALVLENLLKKLC